MGIDFRVGNEEEDPHFGMPRKWYKRFKEALALYAIEYCPRRLPSARNGIYYLILTSLHQEELKWQKCVKISEELNDFINTEDKYSTKEEQIQFDNARELLAVINEAITRKKSLMYYP